MEEKQTDDQIKTEPLLEVVKQFITYFEEVDKEEQ